MAVLWLTAFIDHPADVTDAQRRFWQTVTNASLSARRGERGEFATLVPVDNDPYLRVQETDDGSTGIHLDLHVDDVAGESRRAIELGATEVERVSGGVIVMQSPAGLRFCLVEHHGESSRPSVVLVPEQAEAYVFDQISIDVPHDAFESECTFWSSLTRCAPHRGSVPEFVVLERAPGFALRVLMQRLGPDDNGTSARAHLDAAVGSNGESIAAWHETLGASILRRGRRWITLVDPAGLPYCLTERDPLTGTL